MVKGFKDNLSQEDLLSLHIRQIECCDEDMHKHQFERWFETRLVHGNCPPGTLGPIRNTAIEKKTEQENQAQVPRTL